MFVMRNTANYETLGVPIGARRDDVKAAFRCAPRAECDGEQGRARSRRAADSLPRFLARLSVHRKLAIKWHPDKWLTKSEEERAHAERTFKSIQAAFDALTAVDEEADTFNLEYNNS